MRIVRATELVNKLLIAARISHQPITLLSVPLYGVVARIMAEMDSIVSQKSLKISLTGIKDAAVLADETLLALMVTNIIENAVKYNNAHGSIDVCISDADTHWLLAVSDSGPGIAANERAFVFQRFYRSEIPQGDGTGLGLAIVADILERMNGSVALSTPAEHPGLIVEILLIKA